MPRRNASRKMSRSSVTASRSKLRSLGKGDGFLSLLRVRPAVVAPARSVARSLACSDDLIGLVAKLGGELPVGRQHLGRVTNLFLVARGVGGDLRGLWPLKAALLERLAICWRRGLEASRYSCV